MQTSSEWGLPEIFLWQLLDQKKTLNERNERYHQQESSKLVNILLDTDKIKRQSWVINLL